MKLIDLISLSALKYSLQQIHYIPILQFFFITYWSTFIASLVLTLSQLVPKLLMLVLQLAQRETGKLLSLEILPRVHFQVESHQPVFFVFCPLVSWVLLRAHLSSLKVVVVITLSLCFCLYKLRALLPIYHSDMIVYVILQHALFRLRPHSIMKWATSFSHW